MSQFVSADNYGLAVGSPPPGPAEVIKRSEQSPEGTLRVVVSHEAFTDWLIVAWEGQSSEEMTHQETLEWFKKHGAKNMEKVNEAVNCALNFGKAVFTISNPIKQSYQVDPIDPKI